MAETDSAHQGDCQRSLFGKVCEEKEKEEEMISEEHNCVFIHIAKTGGTSIRKVLGKDDKTSHATVKEYIEMLGKGKYERMFSFTIVRNPWDKMVSAYTMPRGKPENFTADHKAAVTMEFNDWLAYIEKQIKEHKMMASHVRSYTNQLDMLENHQGNVEVDYIGRFEKLLEDWDYISRFINHKVPLPKLAESRGRKLYQDYYNQEGIQVVARLFEKDLAFFGYEF